jgi:hypothetical protein
VALRPRLSPGVPLSLGRSHIRGYRTGRSRECQADSRSYPYGTSGRIDSGKRHGGWSASYWFNFEPSDTAAAHKADRNGDDVVCFKSRNPPPP